MTTTLAARITKARDAVGLTPTQLANRLGVKKTTVDNWEKGKSEPRANKLLMLAGLLNVPVTWLVTGDAPEGCHPCEPVYADARRITEKIDRAMAVQQQLAALLVEINQEVTRLENYGGPKGDMAA